MAEKISVIAEFDFGELVTCKTEKIDKAVGVVTAYILMPGNTIMYQVNWNDRYTNDHYSFELEKHL